MLRIKLNKLYIYNSFIIKSDKLTLRFYSFHLIVEELECEESLL